MSERREPAIGPAGAAGGNGGGGPVGGRGPVPVREALGLRAHAAREPETVSDRDVEAFRAFELDGERWLARIAGAGAAGTGQPGAAYVVAVHFHRGEEPERPVREALIARGRFEGMYEEELRALYRAAVDIVRPEEGG